MGEQVAALRVLLYAWTSSSTSQQVIVFGMPIALPHLPGLRKSGLRPAKCRFAATFRQRHR